MTPIIFLGRTAELYTTEPFESARTWFCANGTYSRAVGYNPSAFRPCRWSRKCLCLNGSGYAYSKRNGEFFNSGDDADGRDGSGSLKGSDRGVHRDHGHTGEGNS